MEQMFRRTAQQVLDQFGVTRQGLTTEQVEKQRATYGENALTEGQKKGPLVVFLEQFKDLLVIILIIAALISAVSGNGESTIVIVAVITLNAILGTVQHFKAEKSLESLKALSSPNAKVMRNGRKIEIPSKEVVPGDILTLEAGDLVVADGRIIENYSLQVNESSLTGEVGGRRTRSATSSMRRTSPWATRRTWSFPARWSPTAGPAVVVTATGMQTEIGKIADPDEPDPAEKDPAAGEPGQLQPEAGHRHHGHLRGCIWPEHLPRHGHPGLSDVRRGAGSGRHSGGAQLHCHHRSGDGHPEDGPGKRHHQRPEGGGKPGLGLGHLLG